MDENYDVIAVGNHDWENQLVDDIWTYSIEDIWKGVRASYKSLADDAKASMMLQSQQLELLALVHDARIYGI